MPSKVTVFSNLAALVAVLPVQTLSQRMIQACKEQSCGDCTGFALVDQGFPNCVTYESRGNIDDFATEEGMGYDVWWNSLEAGDNCKIIVRTPASTDLPECGYFLTSWEDPGCYYTFIQESFMTQYCCGTGDCGAAAPARSMGEARVMGMQGGTAALSLKFDNMTELETNNKRDLGDGVSIHWAKRSPSSPTQKAAQKAREVDLDTQAKRAREVTAARRSLGPNTTPDNALTKRDCSTYTEDQRYTKGGRQQRVSDSANCNVGGDCMIALEFSTTTGMTTSIEAGFNLFEVISASTGIEFTEEETRAITYTFTQPAGSTGYVTFIPTLDCTMGPFTDCDGDGVQDGDVVEACTPLLRAGGDGDVNTGTYSFVYEN